MPAIPQTSDHAALLLATSLRLRAAWDEDTDECPVFGDADHPVELLASTAFELVMGVARTASTPAELSREMDAVRPILRAAGLDDRFHPLSGFFN